MAADSDTKRVMLRGVYEDNLGLPRSFSGKRSPPSDPALEGREKTTRKAIKIASAALVAAIALLGLEFRIVAPESPRAAPGTLLMSAEPAVPYPANTTLDLGQTQLHMLAGASATEQYAAMLSHLDIPVANLFDLKVQTIVIDPGHGGRDPGAVGHGGLKEKDIALDIARRLRDKLLVAGNYRVLLTREDDSLVRLKERVAFAKQSQADLFISIHINSVPEHAGPLNYVETYYFGPHADQRTLDLAEKENRDSDYAMGDFRAIIARIGDTLKTEESARLAAAIHERLYTNLKRHSSDILDAGAKTGPFVVLLGVEVPSVLVEVSCISNETEADRLNTPSYRDSVAGYLEMGVVEYLNQRTARVKSDGVSTPYVAQQDQ